MVTELITPTADAPGHEKRVLQARLAELEETVRAIRSGAVDAIVVANDHGNRVYSLAAGDTVFRHFVERMQDGAATIDRDSVLLWTNRRLAEILRGQPGRLVGSDLMSHVHPEDAARVRRVLQRGHRMGKSVECRIRATDDGRSIPVHIGVAPIVSEGVGIRGLVITDLREQKRRERSLRRTNAALHGLNAHLEAANGALDARNAELSDFASVVSHDLRAPLRRLQVFADLASVAQGKDAELADLLVRIRSSAHRMDALVVDLLSYARLGKEGMVFRRIDLNGIVVEALREMAPALGEAHSIVDLGHLPMVDGDPILLHQLFMNLIDNAIKFATPGVTPIISITGAAVSGSVLIKVKDNGIGFDQSYAERIFRIFERVSTDTPGTGVGLAICRKIADLHRGAINAVSMPGEGATFILHLPVDQRLEQP